MTSRPPATSEPAASNSGALLDHILVKVSHDAFEVIGKAKAFVGSNLFFADHFHESPNSQAHYWNGPRSYVEIFDVTKSDKMEYGAGENLGIGFLNDDDRARSSAFFRKMYGYPKTPMADELVRLEVALDAVQSKNLKSVLTVLGWRQVQTGSWCRAQQCVQMEEASDRGKSPTTSKSADASPRLTSADFSLGQFAMASPYDFGDLKLQKSARRLIRISVRPK